MQMLYKINVERFKQEMLFANKNVTDLAKEAGITTVSITNLLNGKSCGCRVKTCNKLAKALNVPVDELFTV